MVGKSKTATPAEKKRMGQIKGLGCIACLLNNWPDVQCEVHHVVEGGRRLGHRHTMGLCLWHHRGEIDPAFNYTKQEMGGMLGPSYAHGSRYFAEVFGDQGILVAVQDHVIKLFEADPWLEFAMPRGVVLDVQHFWLDLRKQYESP